MAFKIKGRWRMAAITLALLAFALITAQSCHALGITPGRTTYSFEPGAEKQFSFSIVNNGGGALNLKISVSGELNKSVTLSEQDVYFNGTEKKIDVLFKMPSEMEPGAHKAYITATTSAEGIENTDGTYLGARLGIVTEIVVLVPYPGKYLDIGMNVVGPDKNGEVQFVFPAINRGLENISRASVVVDIFDSNNSKIVSLGTGGFSIASGERKELVARWDAEDAPFGKYRFSAVAYYDDEARVFENYFTIGEPVVEIRDIKVKNFRLGGIAKFEMTVQNEWNENLTGVYSDMVVYDAGGRAIANFRSTSETIGALGQKTIVSYWDTSGVKEATYDSSVSLVYNQKSNEKKFKLEVQQDKINVIGVGYVITKAMKSEERGSLLVPVLITAVAVLAIINLLWFLYFRKRFARHPHHAHHGR